MPFRTGPMLRGPELYDAVLHAELFKGSRESEEIAAALLADLVLHSLPAYRTGREEVHFSGLDLRWRRAACLK